VDSLAFYEKAAELVRPIEQRLRSEMENVLGESWCRHWADGLPPYVDVPGEVNLQEILRLWSYSKALDLVEWGRMRYNLMGNAGHWFPGSNAAGANVAKIQKALQGYRFASRIGEILQEAHALLHAAPKKRLSEGG
jgi:predicted aldo/keto reductase-like oxidoreductase